MKNLYLTLLLLLAGFSPRLFAQGIACSNATNAANVLVVNGACGGPVTISDNVVNDAPAPSCGTATRDGWFSFVATQTNAAVTAISSSRQLLLQVYSGACGSLTQIGCANANTNNGAQTEIVTLTGLTIGTTYRIRVVNETNNTMGLTSLCVTSVANDEPCTATSLTVGGSCSYADYNNVSATNTPGIAVPACETYSGGDVWFSAVVPASGALNIAFNDGQSGVEMSDGGAQVFTGTCGALTEIACDNDGSGTSALMPSFAFTCLTPGITVWIRFFGESGNRGTFQVCAYNPGGSCVIPTNDDPCAATTLTVAASCSYTTYTNQNATATTAGSPPAPGCAGYSGADVWFKAIVPASGALTFDTQTGVILDGGMAAYSGNCGSLTLITCDDNSGSGAMPQITLTCLTPGATIHIRFWENGNDNNGTFGICVTDPYASATAPANDAPCNAIGLNLGGPTTGTVTNATFCGEPAAPACWTNTTSQLNTVWYSVVCPASGKLSIRTGLGTLTNTLMEVFSGTCGSLTSIGCSDNASLCGNTQLWSELILTGLTSGATYFIRVDGYAGQTGDFSITAIDGNSTWPIVFGQDCSTPLPVCNSTASIGNPGFIGSGNYCDYPGGTGCPACITVGERNAVWYTVTTSAAGTLTFTVTPTSLVDYDFALWNVTSVGSYCGQISSGALAPVRCSYASAGGTGATGLLAGSGDNCEGSGGNRFVEVVPVAAGETFVLMVSNFSTSSFVGFNMDWGTSPINYSAATTLAWTGATSTDWNTTNNWGGCTIPDCTKDLVLYGGPTNQPVIPTGTTINCRNLTIQPGASLTLQGTAVLNICGNFTNFGSLIAASTSTVNIQGTGVQTLDGTLSGANAFGNMTINKTAGSVVLNQNTDITGNLTTSSGTSVLNVNGKYVKIGGNVVNNNGGTTITNTASSTFEFNGTAAQGYNQGSSTLTLNNVVMNNTGTGLTLNSQMVLGTAGVLTLTQGTITTGANELRITNTAPTSCPAGNSTSYVIGNLRRYLNGAAASYDLPVGHATKGYQRANITFTTATTIPQLLARFDTWGAVPNGPAANECVTATYNALPAQDNGYWTITASANATSGTYNTTLYSGNVTNTGGAAGWTVMKAATGAGPWSLNGTCVVSSTASSASRTGMNGFSAFAVAQSATPLPIELLYFQGTTDAEVNHLKWATATETGNDYFTLERSTDGISFEEIGRVDGAGTSMQRIDYTFDDQNPSTGYNYYRLKQTDFNGQSTYSNIVALEFHRGFMAVSNVRPNPTNGAVDFDFSSPEETDIHLVITDMTGRIVADEHRRVKPGRTVINTFINDQAPGVYSMKVVEEKHGFISVTRIVKY
jgi:hypothetical protein